MLSDGSVRPFPAISANTLNVPSVLGGRPGLRDIIAESGMPMPTFSGTFPSIALAPYVYGGPDAGDGEANDQGQRAQFHVINRYAQDSRFAGDLDARFIGQAELCFTTAVPPDYEDAVLSASSTSQCPEIQALTLPMINSVLRSNHDRALQLYNIQAGLMQGLDEAVIRTNYLILSNERTPFGRTNSLGLKDDDVIALRYAFGAGILKTFNYLGAIQAQPNVLYEPGDTSMHSMTADHGQTMISTQIKNVGYVRSYWGLEGMVNTRSLYLILRPYNPRSTDGTGKNETFDQRTQEIRKSIPSAAEHPFQFVPYCPAGLSSVVPLEERLYTMVNGKEGKAKLIFVGNCTEAEGYRGMDTKTRCQAANIGYANEKWNATVSFNAASSLPMQRFRANPMKYGTGLDFTN